MPTESAFSPFRCPPLVGLCGFKRAGKDTLAEALVSGHGYTRFAFADVLRREVNAIYHLTPPPDGLKDAPGKDGVSYRDLLLRHGAHQRAADPDYFVTALAAAVRASAAERVVLSDCRFAHELDWVRRHDGVLVWVARAGVAGDGSPSEQDNEAACDFTVQNTMGPAWRMARDVVQGAARGVAGRCEL